MEIPEFRPFHAEFPSVEVDREGNLWQKETATYKRVKLSEDIAECVRAMARLC